MNILAVFFHFPPISGGGSVLSYEIVNSFLNQGHQIFVIVPDVEWYGKKFEPQIKSKIKLIRVKIPLRNNIKIAARLCRRNLEIEIIKLSKKEKFDFIFTIFHPFHMVSHAAISAGNKLNIPVIVKIDDAIFTKSKGLKHLQRIIEKKWNGNALQNANKILVANEGIKKIILKEYNINEEKIIIIPNGIDVEFFKNIKKQKKPTLVFSGMMYDHRGIDILLNSLPIVITKFPDIRVILLGEGPEIEKLKKITTELNLIHNVEFKGWVDRKEIPNFLSESYIGIGPLKLTDVTTNALPIKVLEYMASSLPILSKKGTLSKEVLEDNKNGFLVEDSKELANKIIKLLSDEELREKMGENSFRMVQSFDWSNITTKILQLYNDIKK